MQAVTLAALGLAVVLALGRHGEAVSVHRLAATEEDYDFRPRRHYGDYLLPRRSARADDAFDDYGHLRFGRSDD